VILEVPSRTCIAIVLAPLAASPSRTVVGDGRKKFDGRWRGVQSGRAIR
jgi:hypothetical protein